VAVKAEHPGVAVIYFLVLLWLISFVPMVKSFPCGCTFKHMGFILESPPLLFDSSVEPTENGSSPEVAWSIDWLRLGKRMSTLTSIALLAFILARDRKP
jgi:hypothetical protein